MSNLQNLIDKVQDAAEDFANLKIQTVMGELELKADNSIDFKQGQTIQGVVSNINLIDGDIKTQISEEFYKNYPELVQFQQSRESKGHEIITSNIATISTLVKTIKDIIKDV